MDIVFPNGFTKHFIFIQSINSVQVRKYVIKSMAQR